MSETSLETLQAGRFELGKYLPLPTPVTIRPTSSCAMVVDDARIAAPIIIMLPPMKSIVLRPSRSPMKYVAMEPTTQPILYIEVMLPCMSGPGLLKSRPKRLSAPMIPAITPRSISRGLVGSRYTYLGRSQEGERLDSSRLSQQRQV